MKVHLNESASDIEPVMNESASDIDEMKVHLISM